MIPNVNVPERVWNYFQFNPWEQTSVKQHINIFLIKKIHFNMLPHVISNKGMYQQSLQIHVSDHSDRLRHEAP